MDVAQRYRQHQFGTGQKQVKGDLFRHCSLLDMAGTQTEVHGRGISGDEAQAALPVMVERDAPGDEPGSGVRPSGRGTRLSVQAQVVSAEY